MLAFFLPLVLVALLGNALNETDASMTLHLPDSTLPLKSITTITHSINLPSKYCPGHWLHNSPWLQLGAKERGNYYNRHSSAPWRIILGFLFIFLRFSKTIFSSVAKNVATFFLPGKKAASLLLVLQLLTCWLSPIYLQIPFQRTSIRGLFSLNSLPFYPNVL